MYRAILHIQVHVWMEIKKHIIKVCLFCVPGATSKYVRELSQNINAMSKTQNNLYFLKVKGLHVLITSLILNRLECEVGVNYQQYRYG